MKVDITISQDEVHRAIADWIVKQPEYDAVRARDVHVSWKGGACDISPGGKVKRDPIEQRET